MNLPPHYQSMDSPPRNAPITVHVFSPPMLTCFHCVCPFSAPAPAGSFAFGATPASVPAPVPAAGSPPSPEHGLASGNDLLLLPHSLSPFLPPSLPMKGGFTFGATAAPVPAPTPAPAPAGGQSSFTFGGSVATPGAPSFPFPGALLS